MGNVSTWIALACLVVVCALATTLATRVAYGSAQTRAALSAAELERRFRRARLAGWILSLSSIFVASLSLVAFWPPTGWLVGALAGMAVLLVAILVGLDHPRAYDIDESFLDD